MTGLEDFLSETEEMELEVSINDSDKVFMGREVSVWDSKEEIAGSTNGIETSGDSGQWGSGDSGQEGIWVGDVGRICDSVIFVG